MQHFKYTPASEMLLRHEDHLQRHQLAFAGDIQDDLARHFPDSQVFTNQYHHHQRLRSQKINSHFDVLIEKSQLQSCNLFIYYWPKSKDEAVFQLQQLLSMFDVGDECLIVGENRSGVRSVEKLFAESLQLQKIDTAKRCSLYYGKLFKVPDFNLEDFWRHYQIGDLQLTTLPGVFSAKQLDMGTALMIQSYTDPTKNLVKTTANQNLLHGSILDLCCGNGVIAVSLEQHFVASEKQKASDKSSAQTRTWLLADVNANALASAEKSLIKNPIASAKIIASNLFSEINQKFDHIITNPPFHDGQQTDYSITERLIRDALSHLNPNGRLRLVANGFLPYEQIMQTVFGNVECIVKNTRFSVYESVRAR